MGQKIAPCGNDCSICPRYTAQSTEDLQKVAELWCRVGWRDSIMSPEEIKCSGCSSHQSCAHGIIECIREKCVPKCSQCCDFPCKKTDNMLKKTKQSEQRCRELCSDAELMILKKAFFEKEVNIENTK